MRSNGFTRFGRVAAAFVLAGAFCRAALAEQPELPAPGERFVGAICRASSPYGKPATADSVAIPEKLIAELQRPDAQLTVESVAVVGDWAVAGWRQDGIAGRALLKRHGPVWWIRLCTGASLKSEKGLRDFGLPRATAAELAKKVETAESLLPPETVARLDGFAGTVILSPEIRGLRFGGD